jgi:hypothetical protein
LAGIIVPIVPMLFALLMGKYFFKMHPGILLGACAGARASTAALSVIQDAAQSRVPALGFTVCYAVANSFRLLLQFLKKKPMCAQVRTIDSRFPENAFTNLSDRFFLTKPMGDKEEAMCVR